MYVVVRLHHETEALRFRACYGVTEKRSVTVDTRSLKEGNTMAVILWSLNNVTEHFSAELLPSAGATENVAEFRSQTVVVKTQDTAMNTASPIMTHSRITPHEWLVLSLGRITDYTR